MSYVLLFRLFKATTEIQNSVAPRFHLPKPKNAGLLLRTGFMAPLQPVVYPSSWWQGACIHSAGCEPEAKLCPMMWDSRDTAGTRGSPALLSHHPCFALLPATAKFLPLWLKRYTSTAPETSIESDLYEFHFLFLIFCSIFLKLSKMLIIIKSREDHGVMWIQEWEAPQVWCFRFQRS